MTETTKRPKFVADRTVNLNVAESFLLSLAAQFSTRFWGELVCQKFSVVRIRIGIRKF